MPHLCFMEKKIILYLLFAIVIVNLSSCFIHRHRDHHHHHHDRDHGYHA